ncbi:hypothetical protein ACOSP7_007895 [Xanthoceras sorbifolium]
MVLEDSVRFDKLSQDGRDFHGKEPWGRDNRPGLVVKQKSRPATAGGLAPLSSPDSRPATAGGLAPLSSPDSSWRGDLFSRISKKDCWQHERLIYPSIRHHSRGRSKSL